MRLTELIELCQAAITQHGDLEVVVYSTEDIHDPDVQIHPTVLDGEEEFVIR